MQCASSGGSLRAPSCRSGHALAGGTAESVPAEAGTSWTKGKSHGSPTIDGHGADTPWWNCVLLRLPSARPAAGANPVATEGEAQPSAVHTHMLSRPHPVLQHTPRPCSCTVQSLRPWERHSAAAASAEAASVSTHVLAVLV